MLSTDGALGGLLAQLLRALVAHAHVTAGQDCGVTVVHQANHTEPLLLLLSRLHRRGPSLQHTSHVDETGRVHAGQSPCRTFTTICISGECSCRVFVCFPLPGAILRLEQTREDRQIR